MKDALTNASPRSRFDPSFWLLLSYVVSSVERRLYNNDLLFALAMLGFFYTVILSIILVRKRYIEDGKFTFRRQGWFLFYLVLSAIILFISVYNRLNQGLS